MTENTETQPTLYKLLIDGRSYNGGNFEYSLPTQRKDGTWKPGKWHHIPADQDIEICARGFHLTDDPSEWYGTGATVYLAEGKGESDGGRDSDHKIAFRSARLLRPIPIKGVAEIKALIERMNPLLEGIRTPDGQPDPAWVMHANSWEMEMALFNNRPRYKEPVWNRVYRKSLDETERAIDTVEGWETALARRAAEDLMHYIAFRPNPGYRADLKLFILCEILGADLDISDECRAFARASLNVWEKGYTNLGDWDGVLHVTAMPG